MSVRDRSTPRGNVPKQESSGVGKHRHPRIETYSHYRRVPEELSEVDGLRAQVEHLKRRCREFETDAKRHLSARLLLQQERLVAEKEAQCERDRADVAEAKLTLLKAEIASAMSTREVSESRGVLARMKPM